MAKRKDKNTVYAYLTKQYKWPRGERREFSLKSIQSTSKTKISVIGQSGELVEYNPSADATARFEQKEDGLHISVVRAQRIYNNHKWPNPIVVKLENVEPALDPPFVNTISALKAGERMMLKGELIKRGDTDQVEVGFLYRPYAGFAENLTGGEWIYSHFIPMDNLEKFNIGINDLEPGVVYEYRAVVRHPKIEVKGEIKRFTMQ
jgi:alpha-L-fucosidase